MSRKIPNTEPLQQLNGKPYRLQEERTCTSEECGHTPEAHQGPDDCCQAGQCKCARYAAPEAVPSPVAAWVRMVLNMLPRTGHLTMVDAVKADKVIRATFRADRLGVLELDENVYVWLTDVLFSDAEGQRLAPGKLFGALAPNTVPIGVAVAMQEALLREVSTPVEAPTEGPLSLVH